MKINIVSKQIAVTDAIRSYADKKTQHIKRYFPDDGEVEITITFNLEKAVQSAELLLKANGNIFKGTAKSEDLYTSLDSAIDKVERQVAEHKDRLNDRKQNAGGDHSHAYADEDSAEKAEED